MYYTQPPSGTRSLTLDMHLHLHSFYVYVSSYAPGKTVRMCRLVWAFAGRMRERYHNLTNWLVLLTAHAEACKNQFMSWFVRLYLCVMIHRINLLARTHNTISWGRRARLISVVFDKKFHRRYTMYGEIFYYAYCELRKPSNSYKIYDRIFKAQLISGST